MRERMDLLITGVLQQILLPQKVRELHGILFQNPKKSLRFITQLAKHCTTDIMDKGTSPTLINFLDIKHGYRNFLLGVTSSSDQNTLDEHSKHSDVFFDKNNNNNEMSSTLVHSLICFHRNIL